jgi:formylglycine-generating enzyme required for sulfatase activity
MQAGTFITPQLRLVRLVGQGGMGSVWLADHVSLCTQVVVKFCQGDLAARRSSLADLPAGYRLSYDPANHVDRLGFRCARNEPIR